MSPPWYVYHFQTSFLHRVQDSVCSFWHWPRPIRDSPYLSFNWTLDYFNLRFAWLFQSNPRLDVCFMFYLRMAWKNVRPMWDPSMNASNLGSHIRLGQSEIGRNLCMDADIYVGQILDHSTFNRFWKIWVSHYFHNLNTLIISNKFNYGNI